MILIILAAIVSIGILLIIVAFSCVMYFKARKLNPYNRTLERLEGAIAAANDKIYYARQEIASLEDKRREAQDVIDKKESMEKFINEFQEEYDSKQREIAKLDEDHKELSDKLAKAENDLTSVNDEISKQQAQSNELESAIKEMERRQNELRRDIEDKQDKLNKLEEDIESLESDRDLLKNEISKLREEKNSLERQIEENRARYNHIRSEYENNKKELERLTTDLEAANLQWAKEEGRNKAEKTRWEDLDRPYFEYIANIRKDEAESEMLNDFMSALEDSHVVFNERTINAFHTGLKVEDASPLVVLAGISGTGKSLLPSLYAQAFGMNFLSVAVQPRWDSPQDMFGFYNYMQNRYKATELSRMLWQYDIYNNENAAKEYMTEDLLPMSIVLLDEMNLARVEYYFSDMLSKLEIRRNISDKTDGKRRQPAEIEIEGGSIGGDEKARRLFVNSNTLFVGTMNEDETTQSLSDKVMDRSNVLRFGKPSSISAKMDSSVFDSKYPKQTSYMSLNSWKKLCEGKQLPSNYQNRLNDIITSLNDSMAEINHPFAYRVWRSIESYVSLYPEATKDISRFQAALADQIEMKVLPKLNGIDISVPNVKHVLSSMKSTIDQVKDDDLSKAFEQATDTKDGNTFFQWRGVVR